MQPPQPSGTAGPRANELYWTSDRSVNQIAEELDLSKGQLYGLIRPLGAARRCPACGREAAWENRTARDKGILACPACGWGGPVDDAEVLGTHRREDASGSRAVPAEWSPAQLRIAAGGALLGAAAGLALVLWARRR